MINTAAELKTLTQRACESPRVALDTEFLWERTFYPRLGVVQIGFTERECYLVDAVALPTLPGLGELLETRETEKILHDALQDLTILARATGATPRSVFDTRRAAGFCATASTASLLSLLREIMNIEIPKTEQRSNWLRRPLSHKQIAYALNDVRFLPGLRDALVELAEKNGNLAYLNEEMGLFDAHDLYQDPSPEDVFQRMKRGRLRHDGRAALFELIRWRESTAKSHNIPRGHVLRDGDLIALARYRPSTPAEIRNIQGLPRSASTRYCRPILGAIESAATSAPPPSQAATASRLTSQQKARLTERIERIRTAATQRGIDPALVASKADVIELMVAENDMLAATPRCLKGWRRHFVSSSEPSAQ